MARKRLILVLGSVLCLLGAIGLFLWHFWPEPPPTTADELFAQVLKPASAEPSEEDLDQWIDAVASVAKRLPAHEFQKVARAVFQDPQLRQRIRQSFEKLNPEQQKKLRDLIPDEQKMQMMTDGAVQFVQWLKDQPAWARKIAIRHMHARHKGQRQRGGHPDMTRKRAAEMHAKSTPRQRAEFVRAMREMRKMLEEAGVKR